MAIKIISATHSGLDGVLINVEVDITKGIPIFNIVGLPDISIKESKERVRLAIVNSGYEFPLGRITINLAPADVRKIGTLLDLPIALGILMASGQIDEKELDDYIIFGELSLNGELKGIKGAIPIIFEGDINEKKNFIFPLENLKEMRSFVLGNFYPFKTLNQAISFIENNDLLPYKREKKRVKKEIYINKFEDIMGRIVGKALREQAENLGDAMGNHLCNKMLREVDELMVEQEQREEERYKRLDETIRSVQKARQEVAVSKDGTRKKSLFFRKNKRKL